MTRCVLALMLALPTGLSAQADVKQELEKLRGTWALVTAAGKPLPAGVHAGIIFSGEKYQALTNGKVDESGTLKLDPAAKTIDLQIAEGKDAGKTQLGRVNVSGDRMNLILGDPAVPTRPDATASQNELVLARIKPLAKALEGSWEGTLEDPTNPLPVVVTLSNGPDGLATGTIGSPDQGGKGAPLAAVIQSGSRLTLIVPPIRGTFEGELKSGQLIGTWTQGQSGRPLVLKRK